MPIKYLDQSQLQRLFLGIQDRRDKALFDVIYAYGLRVGEAAALRLTDLSLEHGTLFIRRLKGGHSGNRPLLTNPSCLLRDYLTVRQSTGDALFTGRQGDLGTRRIQQLFKQYATEAGLGRYSVHCLRHSIATHLLEAGLDISYVQDHLGHVRIESTKVYAQITDKRRLAAYQTIEKSALIVKT